MIIILIIIIIILLLLGYIINRNIEFEFINFWSIKTEYERIK